MSEVATSPRRTPVHLWIVGVLSLLWNAFGAFDYLASQLPIESYLAQFTPEQRTYFESFPAWSVAFWALGVWGAFAGSILLLLRSRWAVWSFGISLVGLAGSTVYQFALSDGVAVMGSVAMVMNAVIWVIAILLFVYAVRQRKNGVLR